MAGGSVDLPEIHRWRGVQCGQWMPPRRRLPFALRCSRFEQITFAVLIARQVYVRKNQMSKAKKDAYASKQHAAADAAKARELVTFAENAPMPKSAKNPIARKQSRGK